MNISIFDLSFCLISYIIVTFNLSFISIFIHIFFKNKNVNNSSPGVRCFREHHDPIIGFLCCALHRVQELMSGDQRESGRIPRTIECELTQDLVDSCVPGDMVTITGVIKVSNEEGMRHRSLESW